MLHHVCPLICFNTFAFSGFFQSLKNELIKVSCTAFPPSFKTYFLIRIIYKYSLMITKAALNHTVLLPYLSVNGLLYKLDHDSHLLGWRVEVVALLWKRRMMTMMATTAATSKRSEKKKVKRVISLIIGFLCLHLDSVYESQNLSKKKTMI